MLSFKELQIVLSKANIPGVAWPDTNHRIHIHVNRSTLPDEMLLPRITKTFEQLGLVVEQLPDPKAKSYAAQWLSIRYNEKPVADDDGKAKSLHR